MPAAVEISAKKAVKLARKGKPVVKKAVADKKDVANKEENKKKLPPLQKSKVRRSRHEIRVMRREGGTLRFAKRLRCIRKDGKRKIAVTRRRLLKKQKAVANIAAHEAVKGKTTKDGKKLKVVLKKEHKYDIKKMRKFYTTQLAPRKLPSKNFFKDMNTKTRRKIPYLRRSLLPGTVCIVLTGRFRCRRVVFLKQLQRSGLCLVTGPFGLNRVPLRRVSQNFLIATSVKIDFKEVKIPKNINDKYFKKVKEPKQKKTTEEDIFRKKKKTKKGPSDARKKDQKTVDRQIVGSINKRKDRKVLLKYLKTDFGLMRDRPGHKMNF